MRYLLPLLLLVGCAQPPVAKVKAPPPLPPRLSHPAIAKAAIVPVTNLFDLNFRYPATQTNYAWTLQGSSDLVHWIDLQSFAKGYSPTGLVDVAGTNPVYFYRMMGK